MNRLKNKKLRDVVATSVENYCSASHDFSFNKQEPVVRLHEPTFGTDEIMAALDCLLDTHVTMGPKVKQFEKSFATYNSQDHGIMCNSGSSANLLAVAALANPRNADSLKAGDEVIVSALSWSTTVWPLIQYNLVPVIVDIDPNTMNIDPNEVEKAIGPKTRAIMPVHVYGNPCDMNALMDICERNNLILIEDCCEALGTVYDGKNIGSFGHIGTFSFYYSHHMTTMEGGLCTTDNLDLAETMRILRAHGWVREVEQPEVFYQQFPDIDPRFLFVDVGYNLRATELQGAMGSVQLPKLDGMVKARQEAANKLIASLGSLGSYFAFQKTTDKGEHSWFGLPFVVTKSASFTVSELRDALKKANIESRPIICGNIALQPAMKLYNHRVVGMLSNATAVMERGVAIPCHHKVDDDAITYMTDIFRDFIAA
ncbi:MAG: DegT/DnrJ/EryC1/StrS family aminotransferase [Magnetococcales bacterium]|nr:DegT/DnrJ/EryC1/StrS family aminotransferase [Magnetococcales bacterium]